MLQQRFDRSNLAIADEQNFRNHALLSPLLNFTLFSLVGYDLVVLRSLLTIRVISLFFKMSLIHDHFEASIVVIFILASDFMYGILFRTHLSVFSAID